MSVWKNNIVFWVLHLLEIIRQPSLTLAHAGAQAAAATAQWGHQCPRFWPHLTSEAQTCAGRFPFFFFFFLFYFCCYSLDVRLMCEFLETEWKAILRTVFRAFFSDFGLFLDDPFPLGFLLFVERNLGVSNWTLDRCPLLPCHSRWV